MRSTALVALTLMALDGSAWAQSIAIKSFGVTVSGSTATYIVTACGSGEIRVHYDSQDSPTEQSGGDARESVSATCSEEVPVPATVTFVRKDVLRGLYRSWATFHASSQFKVSQAAPVCVGPDLRLESFSVKTEGALVTYQVKVRNFGSQAAGKFRVGLWRNRSTTPSQDDMGDLFVSFKGGVAAGELVEGEVSDLSEPNGDYSAWAVADSGEGGVGFVDECREANNDQGPVLFKLRNPDLVIKEFEARVRGTNLTYLIEICNEGAANAGGFFVDIHFDLPESAPEPFEPGDVARRIAGLDRGKCVSLEIPRGKVPERTYTSYCVVDADDFVSEPEEGNNHSDPLTVKVGAQAAAGEQGCVDGDFDDFGQGPSCEGMPDCNDDASEISPRAKEICGDELDNDCDLTVDDGCPGVDCVDKDGDGWGVGGDCVLADYDDENPAVHPYSSHPQDDDRHSCVDKDGDGWGVGPACDGVPDCDDGDDKRHPGVRGELCGDGVDNDCDLTVDDGCDGVDCVDKDGDGWGVGLQCAIVDPDDDNPAVFPFADCVDGDHDGFGVGSDCKGPPDCDDTDPQVNGGAQEVCGDGADNDCDLTVDDGCDGVNCSDGDGDGIGVGADCVVSDCDDSNPRVSPWAEERCGDNKDDNCNGIADDGCWGRECVDRDGDGFGSGIGCPGPQDCDDDVFASKPGASEECGDGVDQDCDGTPDDGCDTSVDRDGDGVGVGGGVVGPPDCDDGDPRIHPGRKDECGDGLDNDCDGTVDDGCAGVDCDDQDGDGWGYGAGCVILDCKDDDASIHPWAVEVCGDGKDNDCDTSVDEGCDGVDCVDEDRDSWGVGPACGEKQDCDDKDGGASPWRFEICGDDRDNDCDGGVDERCLICEDKDGDTHGIGPKCASWDCNDNNPAVYPGAEEICDLQDNNCDGEVPQDELECALTPGCVSCRVGSDQHFLGLAYAFALLLWLGRRRRGRRSIS